MITGLQARTCSWLEKLGFSAAKHEKADRKVIEQENYQIHEVGHSENLAKFMAKHCDTNGTYFLHLCMAWTIHTGSSELRQNYFKKQSASHLAEIEKHLVTCRAWDWLHQYSPDAIRGRLSGMTSEARETMRTQLNHLNQLISQQQEGTTHA